MRKVTAKVALIVLLFGVIVLFLSSPNGESRKYFYSVLGLTLALSAAQLIVERTFKITFAHRPRVLAVVELMLFVAFALSLYLFSYYVYPGR